MKKVIGVVVFALPPPLAGAADNPEWAFPVTEKDLPAPRIPGDKPRTVGSLTVTRAGADEFYNVPNWRPNMHPAMPKIVQFGNKDTAVRGCGSCHLPTGTGHDESAYVAGLPTRYFIQQMTELENCNRKVGAVMIGMSQAV